MEHEVASRHVDNWRSESRNANFNTFHTTSAAPYFFIPWTMSMLCACIFLSANWFRFGLTCWSVTSSTDTTFGCWPSAAYMLCNPPSFGGELHHQADTLQSAFRCRWQQVVHEQLFALVHRPASTYLLPAAALGSSTSKA